MTDNVYGGTFRLFDKILTRYGLTFSFIDTSDLTAVERAFTPQTRLLFLETPTNPVLRVSDIAAAAALAHARGIRVAVDNTFASPCLQRPLGLGADMVVHSTTKYLNGHSDSVGGAVIAARETTSSGCDSSRIRPARSSVPSTAGWSCAAPRPSPSAWRGTRSMAWRSRSSCRRTRK